MGQNFSAASTFLLSRKPIFDATVFALSGTAVAWCLSTLMKSVKVTVKDLLETIRDEKILLTGTCIYGFYVLGTAIHTLKPTSHDDDLLLEDSDSTNKSEDDKVNEKVAKKKKMRALSARRKVEVTNRLYFYLKLSGILVLGLAFGSVVILWSNKIQHSRDLAVLREQNGHAMAQLRLKLRGVEDWIKMWQLYMEYPSGTSVVIIHNDTSATQEFYATHPLGAAGGVFEDYSANCTLQPEEWGILKTNRAGWGVGRGVSITTNIAAGVWKKFNHGEVLKASNVLRGE